MSLVDAYDYKTGRRLPYLVPEEHLDHPVLGARIRRLPSNSAQPSVPTVEPGSVEEAHQLQGAALAEALDVADLSKSGTADEKRARLAEHRAAPAAADNPNETPDVTHDDEDTTNTPDSGDN